MASIIEEGGAKLRESGIETITWTSGGLQDHDIPLAGEYDPEKHIVQFGGGGSGTLNEFKPRQWWGWVQANDNVRIRGYASGNPAYPFEISWSVWELFGVGPIQQGYTTLNFSLGTLLTRDIDLETIPGDYTKAEARVPVFCDAMVDNAHTPGYLYMPHGELISNSVMRVTGSTELSGGDFDMPYLVIPRG